MESGVDPVAEAWAKLLRSLSQAMARLRVQMESFDDAQMRWALAAGVRAKAQLLASRLAQILALFWDEGQRAALPACVRDALYGMEDMVDDLEYHMLKFQPHQQEVRCNLLISLVNLRYRLIISHASRSRFLKDLDFVASEAGSLLSAMHKLEPTAPSLPALLLADDDHQVVFGRHKEVTDIVRMLIDPPASHHHHPTYDILPIVGMGGVGKTTLAKLVYDDAKVKQHFELRLWASVSTSGGFHKIDITEQILRSANPTYPASIHSEPTLDMLQFHLSQLVASKRFLLVLDDIREESFTSMACQEILSPLSSAEKGSRILVTTTTASVPAMLGASCTYHLNVLDIEDLWSLLKKYAFHGGPTHDSTQELEEIGRNIASKLKGLPLAAKMLGGLLGATKSTKTWMNVLDKELYGDSILPVLELSYSYLPRRLKQCFSFCSLFPRNYKFNKRVLIQLWMAQGFVQSQNSADKNLEDLAEDYFEELLSRSFFDVRREACETHYVMHDLVHDLAQSVSADQCLRVEHGMISEKPSTARYVSVTQDGLQGLGSFCKPENLRTLIVRRSFIFSSSCFQDEFFRKIRNLRVLDLSCSNFVRLPNSIGELVHLRYLSLPRTLNMLPESVSKLLHLESLCFHKCSLEKLPAGITMLVNLRHLNIATRFIAQVSGIGRLVNLQGSVEFHVKKGVGCTLEELKGLKDLRGKLKIKGLDNVLSKEAASKAELYKKRHLRELSLEWNSASRNLVLDADAVILENLQPPSSIKVLNIKRYQGAICPSWLQLSSLKQLQSLDLINCRNLEILPPLGLLPSLKYLCMKELCTVNQIGHEFYGDDDVPFPSLIMLVFDDFPSLFDWSGEVKGNPFPHLQKLTLKDCPNLVQVPPLPPSVSDVTMERTALISYLRLARLSSPRSDMLTLDVRNISILCWGLFHQLHLESVISLKIEGRETPFATKGLCSFTSLQRLQLCQFDLTDNTLSGTLYALPSLCSLEMIDLPNITSLSVPSDIDFFPKLAELYICNCLLFASLDSLHIFISLKRLVIERCPKLTAGSFPANFKNLTSLKVLSISHCKDFQSFPVGSVPPSLEALHLVGCHQS